MTLDTKNMVHPGFVEIIKQMSPLDAENLSVIADRKSVPIARYIYRTQKTGFFIQFDNVFLENQCQDNIENQAISISSLDRLGLITTDYSNYLADKKLYKNFEETAIYQELLLNAPTKTTNGDKVTKADIQKGGLFLTPLGEAFVSICLKD